MMWCCRKRPVESNANGKSSGVARTVTTLSPIESNSFASLTSTNKKGGNPLHALQEEKTGREHEYYDERQNSASQVPTNQSGSNFDMSAPVYREGEEAREVLLTPEMEGDIVSRNVKTGKITFERDQSFNTDPCLEISPKRKEVRFRLPDCIAVPGSFHKAPVGSSVKVLFNKEWRPGVVMALHSDGTSDVATNAAAGLLRNIACTSLLIADATLPMKVLQGRWYDQSKATWDVSNSSAKCVTKNITTLHQLTDNSGIVSREGSKLVLVTEQLCSWDNGDTWRRAPSREVIVASSELFTVFWKSKPMGLEVSNIGKCSKVLKEKELLHSINNISVSSAEQVSAIAVSCKGAPEGIKLLMCPKLPHNPIPAPYFDVSKISRGSTIEALWGGRYHLAEVVGRTASGDFIVVWSFDELSWTINQLGIRATGQVTDESATEVVDIWKRGKQAYHDLVLIAGNDTSITRHELLKALQLSTATAKQELRYLDTQTNHVTLTEWMIWIGRLCEIDIEVVTDRLAWIKSNTSDSQTPLPIPLSEISSRPGSSFKLLKNNTNSSLRKTPTFINGSPCKEQDLSSSLSRIPSTQSIISTASGSPNRGLGAYSNQNPDLGPPIEQCVLLEPGRGKVVGETGSLVRQGASLESPVAGNLETGAHVDVIEIRGRRAHIVAPIQGWVSVTTAVGETLVCEEVTCPNDNEVTILKRVEESFDFSCHGPYLSQVTEDSPSWRSKLQTFIGMAIIAFDGNKFSQRTLEDVMYSKATSLTITFEEIRCRTMTVRKFPREAMGLSFTTTSPPVLEAVYDDSPAGDDVKSAIGLQLTHINARPIATDIQVPILCSGETRVSLTFRDPTDLNNVQQIDDFLSTSRTSKSSRAESGFMEAASSIDSSDSSDGEGSRVV